MSDGATNEALLLCPPLTSCCVLMDQYQTAVQRFGTPDLESLKLLRRTVGIFFLLLRCKASVYDLLKNDHTFTL